MNEFKDILEEKELKDYIKKYKYFILIGVVIIILIITTVVCIKTNKTQTKKENVVLTKTSKKEISKKEEIKKKIKVDIKGEVLNPTVYELEEKSRVIDQTTPNMIQRICRIFERNPLISKEI